MSDLLTEALPGSNTQVYGFNRPIQVCINTNLTGKPSAEIDKANSEYYWKRLDTTPFDLMAMVNKGKAFTALLGNKIKVSDSGKSKGIHRTTENFARLDVAGIDFDENTSFDDVLCYDLAQNSGSFIVATWNHTFASPRSRIFFCLEQPILDAERASELQRALIYHFRGEFPDVGVNDAVRRWYGTKPDNPCHWIGGMLSMDEVEELIVEYRKAAGERLRQIVSSTPATDADPAVVAKMRAYIGMLKPERVDDYGDWKDVGMALQHALGDSGFEVWDEWSSRSNKYGGTQVCAAKWATFNPGRGITGGTLVKMAEDDHSEMLKSLTGQPSNLDGESIGTPESLPWVCAPEPEEERHPLDVGMGAPEELGWIDEYATFMAKQTGSPFEFNRMVALVLAATAIKRKAVLRMSFGDIHPNLFATIIAPSTVYHKTTSLGKAKSMLNRANLDSLLLPADFSPEGLLKGLASQSCGLVVKDEIGRLFDSHNTKYMRNLKPDLTEIFDGGTLKRQLSHDAITVTHPYLNILGATTPARFYESIGFIDWQDGFLARWIFCLPEGEPDFNAEPTLFTSDANTKMDELARVLQFIDIQAETDFIVTKDAFAHWATWGKEAKKAAYLFGDEIAAAIVGRYTTLALKFALILASVNKSWGSITLDIMQSATGLADAYKAVAYRLLTEKSNFGVSADKMQRVYQAIIDRCSLGEDEKNKGNFNANDFAPTEREIYKELHWKKSELTPILEKLLEIGAVIRTKGSKTDYYAPADYALKALPIRAWGK